VVFGGSPTEGLVKDPSTGDSPVLIMCVRVWLVRSLVRKMATGEASTIATRRKRISTITGVSGFRVTKRMVSGTHRQNHRMMAKVSLLFKVPPKNEDIWIFYHAIRLKNSGVSRSV